MIAAASQRRFPAGRTAFPAVVRMAAARRRAHTVPLSHAVIHSLDVTIALDRPAVAPERR